MPDLPGCVATGATPAEAERITGVNVTLQRDWRRRGFLPSNEGHARFDVFSLAKMRFLSAMAERGIGPASTEKYVDITMNAIAREALRHHTGWERAWKSPAPKASYDAIIVGAGGHGPKLNRAASRFREARGP